MEGILSMKKGHAGLRAVERTAGSCRLFAHADIRGAARVKEARALNQAAHTSLSPSRQRVSAASRFFVASPATAAAPAMRPGRATFQRDGSRPRASSRPSSPAK